MAASQAQGTLGLKFAMKATKDAPTYTEIAEVFDITPPNEQTDDIDVTHYNSPDGFKEFILGWTDPGEAGFQMNLVPGSASEALILAAKAAREARGCQITFPGGFEWQFTMLVKGYEPALPLTGKMTAKVSGRCTGSVTRSQAQGG